MVKIKMAATSPEDGGKEQTLAQLIQHGNLLPVIAGQAIEDLVFGPGAHDRLVASYAEYVHYPMPEANKLQKVAKYQCLINQWKDGWLKEDYLNQVASFVVEIARAGDVDRNLLDEALAQAEDLAVSEFARRLGYPRLDRGLTIFFSSSPTCR